jgi:hypothetical protein
MSCPPGALSSKTAVTHHNWVEEQGGLPRFIERIACHLHFEKGKDVGMSIAIAKNAAQRMCDSGDLNFPGMQQVNAGSRAEACAAVAEWNRMRAAARASK